MVNRINVAGKFACFSDHWSPKVIADLNDSHVLLAKVQGGFVTLGPGEMGVITKGVEHRPVARKVVHLMLIEPQAAKHTGTVESERTVHRSDQIWTARGGGTSTTTSGSSGWST